MRMGWIFFTAFLILCNLWVVGCGDTEEELKIVIEEMPYPGFNPDEMTSPDVSDTGEDVGPLHREETAAPPTSEDDKGELAMTDVDMEEPPDILSTELKLDILEVVRLAEGDKEFKKITSAIPAKMVVISKPQNSLWNVRLKITGLLLMEMTVDDNSKAFINKKTYMKNILKFKKELEKGHGVWVKNIMEGLTLTYSGALDAATKGKGVPPLDYTKEMMVSVTPARSEGKQEWEVFISYVGEDSALFIKVADTGDILSINEIISKK